MLLIILFILIGLLTGLLAGLLGIGGGVITVPALFLIFSLYHTESTHLMHVCIATALATTLITSLGSTWAHHKKRAILSSVLKMTGPGLVLGCLLGVFCSSVLSSKVLQTSFGIMMVCFALYFFFPNLPQLQIAKRPNPSLFLFALLIGILSSLLGVGGGIFMVPILLGYHVSLKNTVASSSAGTLITAGVGTIAYLCIAKGSSPLPYSVGYINIPAMMAIGISSICTTSLGCKLSHTLPQDLTKKVFATVLAITGISMLF